MTTCELPRRFALQRHQDATGISGVGLVAFGTVYPSGRTTLAWCCSEVPSVSIYDSPEQVIQIHGHGSSTDLIWIDEARSLEFPDVEADTCSDSRAPA